MGQIVVRRRLCRKRCAQHNSLCMPENAAMCWCLFSAAQRDWHLCTTISCMSDSSVHPVQFKLCLQVCSKFMHLLAGNPASLPGQRNIWSQAYKMSNHLVSGTWEHHFICVNFTPQCSGWQCCLIFWRSQIQISAKWLDIFRFTVTFHSYAR
jgi:hypothetical protein